MLVELHDRKVIVANIYHNVYLTQVQKIDKFVDYVFHNTGTDYKQDVKDIIEHTLQDATVIDLLSKTLYKGSGSEDELKTKLHLLLRMQTTNIVEVLKSYELSKEGSYRLYVKNKLREYGKTSINTQEENTLMDYSYTELYFNYDEGLTKLNKKLRQLAEGCKPNLILQRQVNTREERLRSIEVFYKSTVKNYLDDNNKVYYNGIYPQKLLSNAYEYSVNSESLPPLIDYMYNVVHNEDVEMSLLVGKEVREKHKVERVVKSVYNFYIEYYKIVMEVKFEKALEQYLDSLYEGLEETDMDYQGLLRYAKERGLYDKKHRLYYMEHGSISREETKFVFNQYRYEVDGEEDDESINVHGLSDEDIARMTRLLHNIDVYNKGKWSKNRIHYQELPGQYTIIITTDKGEHILLNPQSIQLRSPRTFDLEVMYQRKGQRCTVKTFLENVTYDKLRYNNTKIAHDLVGIIRDSYDFRRVYEK